LTVSDPGFVNIAASAWSGVSGISGVTLSGSGTKIIHVDDHLAAQAYAGTTFTIDASAETGAAIFYIDTPSSTFGTISPTDLTHGLVIKGDAVFNILQTDVTSLSQITYQAVAGSTNILQLTGGGNVDLRSSKLAGITFVSLLDSAAYTLTFANTPIQALMGANSNTVVYGGDGGSQFTFGAAGQTAIGGNGTDIFSVSSSTYVGSTAKGGSYQNILMLTGGGTFNLASLNYENIQKITVDDNSTNVKFNNYTQNQLSVYNNPLSASLGDSASTANYQIDLRGSGSAPNVNLRTSGTGSDIVWMGNPTVTLSQQTATLGSGANTVILGYFDWNAIDGGTGTAANSVGNSSANTLVETINNATLMAGNVGFHAIDLGFNDSNLSFFTGSPYAGPTVFFASGANFIANTTTGLVVYGSELGGDSIFFNATDQSYIAGGDAGLKAAFLNHSSNNAVTLSNGLTQATNGTVLDGGSGSTINIASSGVYDFNAVTNVTGFSTVDVGANDSVTLSLNNNGYNVHLAGATGTLADNISGGAGVNHFYYDGSGTYTGTLNGGAGTSTVFIDNNSSVDLSGTTISNIANIDVANGSTLTLTSDQIANGGFTITDAPLTATLVINVSPGTSTLNIATLTALASFPGNIVINDNNNGDTIYSGPGAELINLGTGNDWINAGSGDDTIVANAASGQHAVVIVGNAGATDRVLIGTASQTTTTFDTIIGANGVGSSVGSTTVEVVGGNLLSPPTVVDFQGANLQNLNKLQVDHNATAVFEINQLTGLGAAQRPGFQIVPATASDSSSTLKIVADNGPGTTTALKNIVNDANLYGFSGQVFITVTKNGTGPLPLINPVITDISGITTSGSVVIDESGTTGYDNINANGYGGGLLVLAGTGQEAFSGGSGVNTVIFNTAGVYKDAFTGNGGAYVLDINANADFTGSTVSGTSSSVTMVLAPGVTATVDSSVVDVNPSTAIPASGFIVSGGAVGNNGVIDVVVDNLAFVQKNLAIGSPFISEIVDASGATGNTSIDLTTTGASPALTTVTGSGFQDAGAPVTGVTFTAPVPNSRLTQSSRMTGISRPIRTPGIPTRRTPKIPTSSASRHPISPRSSAARESRAAHDASAFPRTRADWYAKTSTAELAKRRLPPAPIR